MDKKERKSGNSKRGTFWLVIIVIICVIFGFFAIRYDVGKLDKAIFYAKKILNIYSAGN